MFSASPSFPPRKTCEVVWRREDVGHQVRPVAAQKRYPRPALASMEAVSHEQYFQSDQPSAFVD
jgi:hypothetical protein